jgi:hypothetical protein
VKQGRSALPTSFHRTEHLTPATEFGLEPLPLERVSGRLDEALHAN